MCASVWVNRLVISALGKPANELIKSHPKVQHLRSKITACATHIVQKMKCKARNESNNMQDPYDEALKVTPALFTLAESRLGVQEAVKRQTQISLVFIMLLMWSVLGQLCPLLLLLAPMWVWTNHCTVIWLQHYDRSASERVVEKILVQQPTTVFGVVGRISQFAVALFVFVDLEFGVGPVMLYFVLFIAAEVGTFCWHRRKSESQQVAMFAFFVMLTSDAEFNPVPNDACTSVHLSPCSSCLDLSTAPHITRLPMPAGAATSHHCQPRHCWLHLTSTLFLSALTMQKQ